MTKVKTSILRVECNACHKLFYLQKAERRIYSSNDGDAEVEIIEVGFTCPHCQQFFRSYYSNSDLDERVKQGIKNNRQRRAFRRDFDKWQEQVKEMLAQAEKV